MLSTLRNAFKVPELRKRLIFTIVMIAIYRLGNFIPVPGVDASKLTSLQNQTSLLGLYDLFSGGALSRVSIFSIGIMPYINASIIMQLLTIAIPSLESLQKEGEEGRKKIQNITRYLTLPLSIVASFTTYAIISNYGAIKNSSKLNIFLIFLSLTAASMFLVWLGDRITEKGINNGISILIFINIISRIPSEVYQIYEQVTQNNINIVQVIVLILVFAVLFVAVVIVNLSERRIPVQYAGKAAGNKMYKAQTSHIPVNVISSAVIAIIFAISVLQLPKVIAQIPKLSKSKVMIAITSGNYSIFNDNTVWYVIAYILFIVLFTWFYTIVTFKPDEMAENIHKSSGFIPGIRPGEPTERHIESVITKQSILGGIFAGIVAAFPIVLGMTESAFKNISFGGTSLIIEVGVAWETIKILQSQLVMRHYQGFLK